MVDFRRPGHIYKNPLLQLQTWYRIRLIAIAKSTGLTQATIFHMRTTFLQSMLGACKVSNNKVCDRLVYYKFLVDPYHELLVWFMTTGLLQALNLVKHLNNCFLATCEQTLVADEYIRIHHGGVSFANWSYHGQVMAFVTSLQVF